MSKLVEYRRVWRLAILVLLVVALFGPWTFDRINVPAQYDCSPPFVRLEGDFCGMPMTGLWLITWFASGIAGIFLSLFQGSARLREFLFIWLILLPLLPLLSSLLLVWRGSSKRRQIFHWFSLGLASVPLVLVWLEEPFPLILWGIWSYGILILLALLLELLTAFTAGRGGLPASWGSESART